MTKIAWTTNHSVPFGEHTIPAMAELEEGYNQGSGIKPTSNKAMLLKSLLWPLFNLRNSLFIDGFIEREVGKLIRQYVEEDSVFLEIGCGDMNLRRFLPPSIYYNGLDLELSGFHLNRALKSSDNVNVVLASATDIPVESNTASLLVSTETFEHIPKIDETLDEIHRVAKPGAVLLCSIPNNYCYKYQVKGPHAGHINDWTYDEFIQLMAAHQFEYVRGFMKGWWIPFPTWLTKTSYQLPLSPKNEFYNTTFFYVFRIKK